MTGRSCVFQESWIKTRPGKQLISAVEQQLQSLLPTVFGFYLLQIACEDYTAWLKSSPILEKIVLINEPLRSHPDGTITKICSNWHRLPFPDNSIDAIYLPFALSHLAEPQAFLNEIWRILLPSGTLILHGLNPFSVWGIKNSFSSENMPWQGYAHRPQQVKQWLQGAQFAIESLHYFRYDPDYAQKIRGDRLPSLEKLGPHCYHRFSDFYQFMASKQLTPISLIKPRWHLRLSKAALLTPSSQAGTQ